MYYYLILAVMFSTLPFSTAIARSSAINLLGNMVAIAADHGGVNRIDEIYAIKQKISAFPKPASVNKQVARNANAKGLVAANNLQFDQANKYFITAYEYDPADAEIAGNLGYSYLRLLNMKQAAIFFSTALTLAPGRASTWSNLGEVYAKQDQQKWAVACFSLTFIFSHHKDAVRKNLQAFVRGEYDPDPRVREAAQLALQLSLIQGATAEVNGEYELEQPQVATEQEQPQVATEREQQQTAPAIVKASESDGIKLTVSNVSLQYSFNKFMNAAPGNAYLIVDVTIESLDRNEYPYNSIYFKVRDADGFEYPATMMAPDPGFQYGKLSKGDKVRGNVAFEIKRNAKGLVLHYQPIVIFGDYKDIVVNLSP